MAIIKYYTSSVDMKRDKKLKNVKGGEQSWWDSKLAKVLIFIIVAFLLGGFLGLAGIKV